VSEKNRKNAENGKTTLIRVLIEGCCRTKRGLLLQNARQFPVNRMILLRKQPHNDG